MRFLVVGAGALGGYFGGRLLEAGQDVTFLLRERRAAQIAATGLVLVSPFGDATLAAPRWLTRTQLAEAADEPGSTYDVVIVGCKAYDLADTMASFAPAVGPDTMIVPVLNGYAHIDTLTQQFGARHVLGGYCLISAALDEQGRIRHLNDTHKLAFGELDGTMSPRVQALAAAFSGARCDGLASARIVGEMWEKWVQIATAASMTCLMRASIGEVIRAGGAPFAQALLGECAAIAADNGRTPAPQALARIGAAITRADSPVTASMLKDIERGAQIEADQLIGDLLARRATQRDGVPVPPGLLDLVYLHLRAYQQRQLRI